MGEGRGSKLRNPATPSWVCGAREFSAVKFASRSVRGEGQVVARGKSVCK